MEGAHQQLRLTAAILLLHRLALIARGTPASSVWLAAGHRPFVGVFADFQFKWYTFGPSP